MYYTVSVIAVSPDQVTTQVDSVVQARSEDEARDKALIAYLDRYGPGEYRTVVGAPVRPICPPPDPDKPYTWAGDQWLLVLTDAADGA